MPKKAAVKKRKKSSTPQEVVSGKRLVDSKDQPLATHHSSLAPRHLPLTIESVAVSKIKFAAYNPRKDLRPGDPEYQKLKRSLETFGYQGGMVWNKRTGNLVGGHQRLKVLVSEFGVTHVDVSVVDLPLAKEKALNLTLNKVTGEWDDDRLLSLLVDLKNDDTIDATLSGFDVAEMQMLIDAQVEDEAGDGDTLGAEGDTVLLQVSVRLSNELMESLARVVKRAGTSRAAVVREAIERYCRT